MISRKALIVVLVAAGVLVFAALNLEIDIHTKDVSAQSSANTASPTEPLSDLDVYYPGTEALEPDELRIVALGTGMPQTKTGRGVLPGRVG